MTEHDLTPEKLYGQNKAKFCFNINVPDDIKWMDFYKLCCQEKSDDGFRPHAIV